MIKALCILRCSTDRQDLTSQKVDMEGFVKSKGFSLDEVDFMEEAAISAYKAQDEYVDMVNRMKEKLLNDKNIRTVFAWHINRLGRREKWLFDIKDFFMDNGIQLYLKEGGFYLLEDDGKESAMSKYMYGFMASSSRVQIDELIAKGKRTKRLNSKNGKTNGGIIKFGYCADKNGYVVPFREEADLVLDIYHYYLDNDVTIGKVVEYFTSKGYTYRGKPLTYHLVDWMLKDTCYIGYVDYKTTRHNEVGKEFVRHTERKYVPIMTKEFWDKVQNKMAKSNRLLSRETKHYYFGNKLIVCPNCGYHLSAGNRAYKCHNHYKGNCECTHNISFEYMDGALWDAAEYGYNFSITKKLNMSVEERAENIKTLKNEIAQYQGYLVKLNEKLDKLNDLYIDGAINKDKYESKRRDIFINKKQTEANILKNEESVKQLEGSEKNNLAEWADDLGYLLTLNDEKTMQALVKQYVEKVEIRKEDALTFEFIITLKGLPIHTQLRYYYRPKNKKNKLVDSTDNEVCKVVRDGTNKVRLYSEELNIYMDDSVFLDMVGSVTNPNNIKL